MQKGDENHREYKFPFFTPKLYKEYKNRNFSINSYYMLETKQEILKI